MTDTVMSRDSGVAEVELPEQQTARPSTRRSRPRLLRRRLREYLIFVAFACPNLVLIAVFVYRPLFENMYYSTLNWTLGAQQAAQIGLQNYLQFFSDPQSWSVLRITAIFTVATVGGTLILGLLIAVALNRRLPGTTFARSSVFAPYVLSGVGVGLVWLFIFDPTYGALSGILKFFFSTPGPNWYQSPGWALVMVIIVYVWKNIGYAAIVYLAALQSVPQDVLEAASLDGAGGFTRFTRIIFPLLSPTTFFLLLTTILSSLQSFDIIQIMTKGGPLNGTETLMYDVYQQAFINNEAGYSAAVAMILFVILLLLTVFQLRFLEKRVHYT